MINITVVIDASDVRASNHWMQDNISAEWGGDFFDHKFTESETDYFFGHAQVTQEQADAIDAEFTTVYYGDLSINEDGSISVTTPTGDVTDLASAGFEQDNDCLTDESGNRLVDDNGRPIFLNRLPPTRPELREDDVVPTLSDSSTVGLVLGLNKGPDGDQGLIGDPGIKGPDGDVGLKGADGDKGPDGDKGATGDNGIGIPAGGTTGQKIKKLSNTDYDTGWL